MAYYHFLLFSFVFISITLKLQIQMEIYTEGKPISSGAMFSLRDFGFKVGSLSFENDFFVE